MEISAGSGTPPPIASVSAGDYVQFTRMIQPAKRSNVKDASGRQHGGIIAPEQLVEKGGSGIVLRINRAAKRIGETKVRVARVDAGPVLGIVTAVIDDAILVGVQQSFDVGPTQLAVSSMYADGDHA